MNKKPFPKLTQFNVRLPVKEKELLRRLAYDSNKSVSTFVRDLLQPLLSPTVENSQNNP